MFSIPSNNRTERSDAYPMQPLPDGPPAVSEAEAPLPAPPVPRKNPLQALMAAQGGASGLEAAETPVALPQPPGDIDTVVPAAAGIVAGAGNPAESAATGAVRVALHDDMRRIGCSLDAISAAADALGGKYIPSQSAGIALASLNDHVGVLILPFSNCGMQVSERLAVIKDRVPGTTPDEGGEDKYFIKGYGNRLIGLDDIHAFSPSAMEALPEDARMETSFRTHLKACSRDSPLAARRSAHESTQPVMPVPPNAMPMPLRAGWSNADNYMNDGFGGKPTVEGGRSSPYFAGYADYNAIENRLVIFLTDASEHRTEHPKQTRNDKSIPASVNVKGGVIAEIQGIANVEAMGPAGRVAGVKLASLRELLQRREDTLLLHLRVTTEDGAVHDLRYTADGLKMRLLQPRGAGAGVMAPLEGAQTCVYTYQGRSTGLQGSVAGFSNPELILSTGEALLAGPLLMNRTSWEGRARSAGKLLSNLVALSPTMGATNSLVTGALNTTMRAACVAGTVYGMNQALNMFRNPETHALLDGAHAFSSSGSGVVDSKTLAAAIAVTVVAQDVVSRLFSLAHGTLLKDAWKSKETVNGQIFNEGVLPLAGEFSRLLLNYGIQTGMGLPRGDGFDVATLAGVAGLLTLSGFIKGRSGAPENHHTAAAVLHTVNFFVGDLLFRSLGAIKGNPALAPETTSIDYAEAYLTRMATRGLDKWVAPLLATALSAAGLLGPNANAADDQVTRENRFNGVIEFLRDFARRSSLAGDRLINAGETLVKKDIEAMASSLDWAANALEGLSKSVNRAGMQKQDPNPAELLRVQKASAFNQLDDAAKVAYLDDLTAQFERMVADSKAPPRPSAPGPGQASTSQAAATRSTAVSNSRAQLPEEMEKVVSSLMDDFADSYREGGNNYVTKVSPDFIGAQLMHFSEASAQLGKKTPRVQKMITTFSEVPAAHIARVHDTMAAVEGMPESADDSRNVGEYKYVRLSEAIVREIRAATVKYTQESGFFHYLLRWPQTGQPFLTEVVPGVHIQTMMMNKRGNIGGDPDLQISPRDPLLINLGALHAKKFPAIVHRAVVTDAAYGPSAAPPGTKTISEQERVSLSEILSTTSAEQLAAAFLAALGYGAAAEARSLRIVLNQDTAVNIAKYTELMQAETISLPGGVFVVERVDDNPPVPDGADPDSKNLGRVVYMTRLNTYAMENNYRKFLQEKAAGSPVSLADGTLAVEPGRGHFYRFDQASETMVFEVASKNYFLGTDVERNQDQPARWRYPYTSPASPRGMLDFINAALLLDDPIKPFLNDATRNIHQEEDMLNGGFYADGNEVMDAAVTALKATREASKLALQEIAALRVDGDFPVAAGRDRAAQRELLAQLVSGTLRRPLMMLEVDDHGQPVIDKGEPVKLSTINKTWDGVDMEWEKEGPTMIGVGARAYYAMGYNEGRLTCVPVRIDGDGPTTGNFLHAFMVTAYPNGARMGYVLKDNAVRSATADTRLQGRKDALKAVSKQLLGKLQNFARSDYIPLQSWLSGQYGGPHYPPLATTP